MANLIFVGKREREDEGYSIPRNEAVCRRGLGSRIPSADEGPEESKGQDGDGDT
jgi:hypothetical protein